MILNPMITHTIDIFFYICKCMVVDIETKTLTIQRKMSSHTGKINILGQRQERLNKWKE
jgi:hypothetical protein